MDIKLEKWVELVEDSDPERNYNRKVADVLSQLLIHITDGIFGVSLNGCSLSFDDSADITAPNTYGEVVCTPVETYTEKDVDIKPHNYNPDTVLDQKTAVFVTGLILYYMVKKETPVMSIFEQAKTSGPLFSLPDTRFDIIIQKMTETDSQKRINAQEALDMLAEQFPADARILISEKNCGVIIGTEQITLERAFTKWECDNGSRKFRNQRYRFPEKEIELRYRASGVYKEIKVGIFDDEMYLDSDLDTEGKYFGVDIGSSTTKIAVFDNGKISSVKTGGGCCIPTAIEYNDRVYYFLTDEENKILVKRDDGVETEVTRQMAAEEFMKKIHELCKESNDICFTYSDEYANFLDDVRNNVFGESDTISFVSPLMAAGTALVRTNKFEGNVLLIDMGESKTNIGIMNCESGNPNAKFIIESSFAGGKIITNEICDKIYSFLDAVNIPMRNLAVSGLTVEKFNHNTRIIQKTAESLKCAMTFAEEKSSISIDMGLARPDNTIQSLKIDSEKCGLGLVIKKYADYILRMMKETISRARLSEQSINNVVIYGRTSASPVISDEVKNIFQKYDCRISEEFSNVFLQSQGAVISAYCNSIGENVSAENQFNYNIGIAVSSVLGGMPEFKSIVSDDDVSLKKGKITFEYNISINQNDAENGCHVLKLYKREKGDNSSYINGIDTTIRYICGINTNVPEDYNYGTDMLKFVITADSHCNVTAEVFVVRKASAVQRFKTMLLKENTVYNNGYYVVKKAVSRVLMR